ncbi:hypothetical protein TI39_contig4776g00001 [Zymoseptoria brevis]|uniref:Uncharacterized protein n=1 Tax=Zymoseptoria brevis TaxID=1047168 RepID=A0A0F4G6C3_9PEZI|nr:hypothetical protein TI39_contig4776g00001 [Zymoseptoria brevis]
MNFIQRAYYSVRVQVTKSAEKYLQPGEKAIATEAINAHVENKKMEERRGVTDAVINSQLHATADDPKEHWTVNFKAGEKHVTTHHVYPEK